MPKLTIDLNDPSEQVPIPIVAEGIMLAVGIADGCAIPVLILDTTNRPDVDALVAAHAVFGTGDVTTAWVSPGWRKRDRVRLLLAFHQPHRCVVVLDIDLETYGGVVDQ